MHPMDQFRQQYDDELAKALARVKELEAELADFKQGAAMEAKLGDEARARIAELEQDRARLDWLDENCTRIADSERYLPTTVYWGGGTHKDIRQAIDAVMRVNVPK